MGCHCLLQGDGYVLPILGCGRAAGGSLPGSACFLDSEILDTLGHRGHSAWTRGECSPLARVPCCVCPGRVRHGAEHLSESLCLTTPLSLLRVSGVSPCPSAHPCPGVTARSPMLSFPMVLAVCPFCLPASQSREGKEVVTTQTFRLITAPHQSPPSSHLVLAHEDQHPVFKGHTGRFHGQALQVWT